MVGDAHPTKQLRLESMSISTTVKTIQDIMRIDEGVDGDAQRISQLTWMIFLKVFDDREMEYEAFEDDYVSPLPDELRWRNWAANPEGITGDELLEFVNNQLFKTLKNINLDEVVDGRGRILKNAFEDAFNFMKNGTLMRQVINKLNEIDFNNSHDKHLFGEIYEQILKDLQSAGNAGEYYTPRAVTQFMVDMINPQLGERILDPACGTGGFLTCALEHLRKQVKKIEEKEKLPPFGGKEEDGIETNFPAAYRTKETADLFLVLIMHLLADGGRGGIVLPDGTLFGEGVKTRIKEKLLEECNLHTIVRLPNGVFNPYTSIKTNLLFFTKGEATQEIWFYEHPYPPGYKSYSKTKPIRIEEFEPEKAWWHNRVENELAWKVPVEVIKAMGYNLDIKNPYREKEKHRDLETMLAEYQELMAGVSETRNLLKAELMKSLSM
jgi:type I restriction enzyme M protein